MPSPGSRRSSAANGSSSSRSDSGWSSRRRGSSCSCPAGGALRAGRLSQPFVSVALRSLLAVDLWLSRRLGVCAAEDSLLGGIRPLVKLLALSAHRTPWISSAAYLLLTSRTAEEQELMINLLMGTTPRNRASGSHTFTDTALSRTPEELTFKTCAFGQ